MKYEFHVGDYVENKYGEVGYITNVTYSDLHMGKDVFYNIDIVYYNVKDIIAFHGDQNLILNYFVRIGQYDFTKRDEGKIEPLACETASDYNNEKLRKKVNELVKAVNELKTDYEKHLRAHELTER